MTPRSNFQWLAVAVITFALVFIVVLEVLGEPAPLAFLANVLAVLSAAVWVATLLWRRQPPGEGGDPPSPPVPHGRWADPWPPLLAIAASLITQSVCLLLSIYPWATVAAGVIVQAAAWGVALALSPPRDARTA